MSNPTIVFLQSCTCNVARDNRVHCMHTRDHHDVHLVRAGAVVFSQHLLRYMDFGARAAHDKRVSSPEGHSLIDQLAT